MFADTFSFSYSGFYGPCWSSQ